MKPKILSILAACAAVATLAIAPIACQSCATNTGDPGKDSRARATNQALKEAGTILGKVAVSALFQAAQQEASGGKVDFQQAATSGLWANVNSADTTAAVARVIDAYSAGNAPITREAAMQAIGSNVTPEKVAAVAAVISSATGAPPAK